MVHSEPFLGRLLVNIFSKIVADFCHDFEFTLYIEVIFPLPWRGGGVLLLLLTDAKLMHSESFPMRLVFVF